MFLIHLHAIVGNLEGMMLNLKKGGAGQLIWAEQVYFSLIFMFHIKFRGKDVEFEKGGAGGLNLATGTYPTLSHSLPESDHLLFNVKISNCEHFFKDYWLVYLNITISYRPKKNNRIGLIKYVSHALYGDN